MKSSKIKKLINLFTYLSIIFTGKFVIELFSEFFIFVWEMENTP